MVPALKRLIEVALFRERTVAACRRVSLRTMSHKEKRSTTFLHRRAPRRSMWQLSCMLRRAALESQPLPAYGDDLPFVPGWKRAQWCVDSLQMEVNDKGGRGVRDSCTVVPYFWHGLENIRLVGVPFAANTLFIWLESTCREDACVFFVILVT